MLFHVKMTVKLPHDMDPAKAAQLKADEKELAQRLQREGTWRHLWRIAGHYANYSVFDVPSVEALHDTLMQLPLFPYMDIEVNGLCTHPSAI
ncbi:muconolactone Delta-isomerase [Pseudomonas sp. PSKL.D1]|uniref:muconolactone Delta-isomerase n=1 Tax=Pseudomonas sp. PSKL.D1 TaxID=3029060 RepID=UPI0023817FD6|nr:muconolactone Delta-isomerase [Pseudomonas sp. PSKL.D1]WDY59955.1 muconolactone Delta-isomerase [Pseudomonas sp. PSKL.D1]